MAPLVDETLEIIRAAPDAAEGWRRLRVLCTEKSPSALWDKLGGIDPIMDVESARDWLRGQLVVAGEHQPILDFADYVLFLGYSGLILAEAILDAGPGNLFLATWGFHDDDLFILGRGDGRGFRRLASTGFDNMTGDDLRDDRPGIRIWQAPD
jgi:hypothetical protein